MLERSAALVALLHHVIQNGFRECALGAVRGCDGEAVGEAAVGTAGTAGDVGLDPRRQAAETTDVAADRSLVADDGEFDVLADFDALLQLLVPALLDLAGFVDNFLRVGDHPILAKDLSVIAEAFRRRNGSEGVLFTFFAGVVAGRSEFIRFPFGMDRRALALFDHGIDRGVFRGDAGDHIRKLFTVADRTRRADGIGNDSHVLILDNRG
ncbi:hypothetical protein D3C80_1431600 [compost metagenome]